MNPGGIDAYLAAPGTAEAELCRIFRPDEALTIFDVGSCEGEDSIRYARRFPSARIFAFEPLPGNCVLAAENLRKYGVTSVELVEAALADRAGEACFHVSTGTPDRLFSGEDWNYGNKSSSLLAPADDAPMYGWIRFEAPITVPTRTLDAFCAERGIDRIDFLHMDVQGAEHLVLQGARRMLPRISTMWLEVSDRALYRGQWLRGDMHRFLAGAGFELTLEKMLEIEGDRFYVNARVPRLWPYLARARALAACRAGRHALGRLRRSLLSREG